MKPLGLVEAITVSQPLSVTINLQKGIIFPGGCWNFDVKCCNLSCKQAGCQERLFDHETLSFCITCNSALVICDICPVHHLCAVLYCCSPSTGTIQKRYVVDTCWYLYLVNVVRKNMEPRHSQSSTAVQRCFQGSNKKKEALGLDPSVWTVLVFLYILHKVQIWSKM